MASINPTAHESAPSFRAITKVPEQRASHTFISSPTLEILLKSLRHIEDFGNMCHAKRGFFVDGKGLCSTHSVFNLYQKLGVSQIALSAGGAGDDSYLSTIKIMARQLIIIRLFEVSRVHSILGFHFVEEHLPHRPLCFRGQFAIPKSDMDAGLEGIIESFDAISGQEQDALKVLQ